MLDLADCTFVDSSILGVVAGAYRWLAEIGVALIAVNATGLPARVLEMMAMDRLLAPRRGLAGATPSEDGGEGASRPGSLS